MVLVVGLATAPAFATSVVIDAAATGEVDEPGTFSEGGPVVRVGQGGDSPGREHSVVFQFALPEIGSSELISAASLSFNYIALDGWSPVTFNSDLYGLGWTGSPASFDPDWFWGNSSDDIRTGNDLGTNIGTSPIWKLQDDIMTNTSAGASSNTPTGLVDTSASGDLELLSFINSLYDSGATAGDLAIFRLNADQSNLQTGASGYRLSGIADSGNVPTLTLSVDPIPEPHTALLLGIGMMGLGLRRRRQRAHHQPVA